MKKLCFALAVVSLFIGCTTKQQDIQTLQTKFDVVYSPYSEGDHYICIDTSKNVYWVTMCVDGQIESQVKVSK